jgi:sodium/bile acid cotransporter 7
MRAFLARRWFLLLLGAGLGVAAARPEWLEPGARLFPLRLLVGLALFLIAWGLESRSLFSSLMRPAAALWAVALSYGLVPACAWLAGHLLAEPDLRVGLLIIASVPCTLASAVLWTRLAGGNEGTALLVILLSTATSWLATTAWLFLGTGVAANVAPITLMGDLAVVLIVPVGLGQVSRALPPLARAAARFAPALGIVSQLLILAVILRAAVDVSVRLRERALPLSPGDFLAAAVLCLLTHLLALVAGFWTSGALGFDRPRRIAVAFGCSQKTLPVALFLFDAHYKDLYPLAVVPFVFYHVGQLVVDTFIADALAGRPRETKPNAAAAEVL